MKTVVIDAEGKSVGRISTHIANILNGKDSPEYAPNKVPAVKVSVKHISALLIPTKKKKQKEYFRHTGYLGGAKKRTMEKEIEIHGYESVLRRAVLGMLPKNRLRQEKLKRISFLQ